MLNMHTMLDEIRERIGAERMKWRQTIYALLQENGQVMSGDLIRSTGVKGHYKTGQLRNMMYEDSSLRIVGECIGVNGNRNFIWERVPEHER